MQDSEIEAALRAAHELDPDDVPIAPGRLERLLRDVLPFEDRAVELLLLGARAGVPAMLGLGQGREALQALTADLGLRPDIAHWTVGCWAGALGLRVTGLPAPDLPVTGLPVPGLPGPAFPGTGASVVADVTPSAAERGPARTADQAPTGIAFARVASIGPSLIVSATALDGVFVCVCDRAGGNASWRRLASPASGFSRDVVLMPTADHVLAVWSDSGGLFCRTVSAGEDVRLGPVLNLRSAARDEEVRYPVAALTRPGSDQVDLFWSPDRRVIRRTASRPGDASEPAVTMPPACVGDERLQCLDAVESDGVGWLAALTDVGRILVARWDIDVDMYNRWHSAAPPVGNLCGVAFLAGEGLWPTLAALTRDGRLMTVDLGMDGAPDGSWRTVPMPEETPDGVRYGSLSMAEGPDGVSAAVSAAGGVWLWPYEPTRHGLRPDGPATCLVER